MTLISVKLALYIEIPNRKPHIKKKVMTCYKSQLLPNNCRMIHYDVSHYVYTRVMVRPNMAHACNHLKNDKYMDRAIIRALAWHNTHTYIHTINWFRVAVSMLILHGLPLPAPSENRIKQMASAINFVYHSQFQQQQVLGFHIQINILDMWHYGFVSLWRLLNK